MQTVLNTFKTKQLRKRLRREQTDAEKLLWRQLRNRQVANRKFYRQFGVGDYVLDFYCAEKKLSVEVDGGQHNDEINRLHDKHRAWFLKSKGIKEVRFWNNEVMTNMEGVLTTIKLHLASSLSKEEGLEQL